MRIAMMVCLLAVFTGCASKFDGEWIEDRPGGSGNPGQVVERRMAIAFHPPSLVRVGMVSPKLDVVDGKTVQQSGYYLFDGWQKAQVGSVIAKVDGDHMTATIGCAERQFVRVKGKSIFPPRVVIYPWG